MASRLVKQVRSLRQLELAWRAIRENARHSTSAEIRREVEEFAEDSRSGLHSLCLRLARGSFRFEPAKGIPLPKRDARGKKIKSKFRPIVLASLESRIIQRSILETLASHPAMEKHLYTPHSFGGVRRRQSAELGAVPAATKAVLDSIARGARFVASADIQGFFTRISKLAVRDIVAKAVEDDEFMLLFDEAIKVELSNLIELREKANLFPTEDIGVAQGSSLSPLLGNILLQNFDWEMNQGDCRCIRYIDDFVVLAPTESAANARMRKAIRILKKLGMQLSPEKSSKGARPVHTPFEFLGIEFNNGFIRPSGKSRHSLLVQIDSALGASSAALHRHRDGEQFPKSESVIIVLRRVDGILQGWGKHYHFCNDDKLFETLDNVLRDRIRAYLGAYTSARLRLKKDEGQYLLGIGKISAIERSPFSWPKAKQSSSTASLSYNDVVYPRARV